MVLDLRFLAAAVGRIHQHHVELIVLGIVQHVLQEGIIVINLRDVQSVQQHVGNAQHIGELLLFNAEDGTAVSRPICNGFHLFIQFFEPTGDEAAGAAGKVRHVFTDLRLNALRHKVGHGAWRIEFTGRTCALQLFQNGFIDLAESMAFLIVGKIQFVDDIDDLPQQNAVLHIVVGVGEGGLHDRLFDGRIGVNGQMLQRGEQGVIDEVQQRVAGQPLAGRIVCPVAPTALFRDDGGIVVLVDLPVLLLGVIDLQKQQPSDLLDALRITVDARIVSHDVPQSLYKPR